MIEELIPFVFSDEVEVRNDIAGEPAVNTG